MADTEAAPEQDDVSFLRTVSVHDLLIYQCSNDHNVICTSKGRYGMSSVNGNRFSNLFGCRRHRKSTLFPGKHRWQEQPSSSILVCLRHRTSIISSSTSRNDHCRSTSGTWRRFINFILFFRRIENTSLRTCSASSSWTFEDVSCLSWLDRVF